MMRYYLGAMIIICLIACEFKKVKNKPQVTDLKQDTIVIKEDSSKNRIYELKYDLYYLEKDSTIFMEYCCQSYFKLILDKDTTKSFEAMESEDNGYHFRVFYDKKDIGGLYTDYNYGGEHRFDKPNMIYVFFENNRRIVPYDLADKDFTFLLKEDKN